MPILLSAIVEEPQILDDLRKQHPKCCECGVALQETITGKRHTPEGEACSDCYYDLLGEEIERQPISGAGVRRH